jgi:hypothetical protein
MQSNNLENIKSNLLLKTDIFNRDRDKLDFLKVLREKIVESIQEHRKTCNKSNCMYEELREHRIFIIDQEIEEINKYFVNKVNEHDKFTAAEESQLHNKLNLIQKDLVEKGFGQQIIFDEIEELKSHFQLGKKTWFQLLKGKVIDLTVDKIIDNTLAMGIYTSLSIGYENFSKLLLE